MAKKNAFAVAKVVPSIKAAKAAAPVEELPGLAKYAAICALEKAVKAVKTRYEMGVKVAAAEKFAATGAASGSVPANFKASENGAEASVQLKKRSSLSVLTAEEIEVCKMHNIPTKVVEGAFYINPAYAGMTDLMRRVGEAIAKVAGVPDDFILKQDDVTIASEEGIAAIFATKDKSLINALMPTQTTLAVRTTTAMKTEDILELVGNDLMIED